MAPLIHPRFLFCQSIDELWKAPKKSMVAHKMSRDGLKGRASVY